MYWPFTYEAKLTVMKETDNCTCIRRICSDDETFEKRSKDLAEHLKQRGYQKQAIDQAIEKVRHMERQNLLSYKPKPTANKAVLPFVLTYHPDPPKARVSLTNTGPS